MILLQANQLARHFGGDTLFNHVHIEVQENSQIALVGRNGAGKSTLLKILAGIEAPDEGTLSKAKNIHIGYLAQNTGLSTNNAIWDEMMTVFDELIQLEKKIHLLEIKLGNVAVDSSNYLAVLDEYDRLQHSFQEKNGYGYEAEIRSVLHGFHFTEDYFARKINTLSGGQKTRLALAKLLLEKPELLILDEPTNHLDIETLTWLENYLQNYSGALLIVSHDRYFLDKVVKEVYELSRSELTHYKGNYSRYLELKEERIALEWKTYTKQQTEIAKLEEFVQKNIVRATTTKRAQSRRKKLEKMERIERPKGDEKSADFLFPINKTSGNVVLTVENSAIGYEGKILAEPVDLAVRRQEAIALVGPNGVGKSTLLKSIIGEIPLIKGTIHLGTNVSIGYYDQEQANLNSNKTVLYELWDNHSTTPEKEIRSILGSFLFTGEDVEKTVPLLSGGEKARLALAKLSMEEENFLILDEPTNHLDIDSKEVLEDSLIDFEGTILFVSHDRYFINRIATKVIELSSEGSKLYLGDYDYYLDKKQEELEIAQLQQEKKAASPAQIPDSSGKKSFQFNKEQQKNKRTLLRKIAQLEKELAAIEERIKKIQSELIDPEYFNHHKKLQELNVELQQEEQQLEMILTNWETESLKLEKLEKTIE